MSGTCGLEGDADGTKSRFQPGSPDSSERHMVERGCKVSQAHFSRSGFGQVENVPASCIQPIAEAAKWRTFSHGKTPLHRSRTRAQRFQQLTWCAQVVVTESDDGHDGLAFSAACRAGRSCRA